MNKIIFTLLFSYVIFGCKNVGSSNTAVDNETMTESDSIDLSENTTRLMDSILVKNIHVGGENPEEKKKFHAFYPSTQYDFINKAEETFVQSYLEEFQENAKDFDESSVSGIDFGQHFELVEHSPYYIGFLIERYKSFGNNYDTQYFTHIYDLKNHDQIEFSQLFGSQNKFNQFTELARDKAAEQIKKKLDEMEGLTPEDKVKSWENLQDIFEEGTAAKNGNFDGFSWDKEGNLTIYFDKYQIASGNFGNIKIIFDKQEYQDLLEPKYQNLLHFKTDGLKEEMTEPAVSTAQTDKTEIDCGKVPCVALTFDDGPSVYTNQLLDILNEQNVKATFFVLGKSAKIQENTLLRTYQEGHQIGNHSWDHKDLKNLSKAGIQHQIYDTNNVIKEITGEAPHVMRPPYGSMNSMVKEVADMPIILWNLDPLDWKNKDAKIVAERMSKAQKNGIVLAHDIHKTTVNAIPAVIKALKEKGYYLVTIDELFAGQTLKNGEKYSHRK